MLYYLRLITLWFQSHFLYESKPHNIFEENSFSVRTMPTECNLFMIMDNSKYNRIVDLSKFFILIHYRKFNTIVKKGWRPLTVALELNLERPIRVFQKYQISSKVIYWENGFVFLEHKFFMNNKLHATALSKACFVMGKTLVQDQELNELYGITSPPMPEIIAKWNALRQVKRKGK